MLARTRRLHHHVVAVGARLMTAGGHRHGTPPPKHKKEAKSNAASAMLQHRQLSLRDVHDIFCRANPRLANVLPQNLGLYVQAFTHGSFRTAKVFAEQETPSEAQTYQRLEFLGDSVLSLIVANYVFQNQPNYVIHTDRLSNHKILPKVYIY